MPRNRNTERQHLPELTRQALLEQDVDNLENQIHNRLDEVERQTERTNKILVGLLISVVTSLIGFVVMRILDFASTTPV